MDFQSKLTILEIEFENSDASSATCSNATKRILYSKLELLRLDIHEEVLENKDVMKEDSEVLYEKINSLTSRLNLVPVNRKTDSIGHVIHVLDTCVRFIAVVSGFITVGSLLSLIVILLQSMDPPQSGVGKNHMQKLPSERLKRFISHLFLTLSGIVTEVQGDINEGFESSDKNSKYISSSTPPLLMFTHASNIDGFMVSSTCPVRHYALAKKELFVVPFFSWISLAVGGVPVDRNNRERAIVALKRSMELSAASTSTSGLDGPVHPSACVVVAPEGTRSTTGQILEFKKGPFYMWEQLQDAPIIPVILIGAYDLYPVGSYVNCTGKVYVRYLPPIRPQEITSKEHALRLTRRRILESLCNCPAVGEPLSISQWTNTYAHIFALFALNAILGRQLYTLLCVTLGLSGLGALTLLSVLILVITAWLYVYYVYIIAMGKSNTNKKESKKGPWCTCQYVSKKILDL